MYIYLELVLIISFYYIKIVIQGVGGERNRMKKLLLFCVISVVSLLFITFNVKTNKYTKIVFEMPVNRASQDLSGGEIGTITIDNPTKVVLQIKTTCDLGEVCNINSVSEKNRFAQHYKTTNTNTFNSLGLTNYKSVYTSVYTPFIECVYDYDYFFKNQRNILNTLENSEQIEKVYVLGEVKREPCLEYSLNKIGAKQIYQSRQYSGVGIKIGILEAGIIDVTHPFISGLGYSILDQPNKQEIVSEHTTQMASVIAGRIGIAKDAMIYSAQAFDTPNNEVDWMIENGVDIINCSYATSNNDGYYDSESAYMDYVVYTYGITVVACAGNTGGYVTNPGLGYNVITVGATNEYCREVVNYSAYNTAVSGGKPTIVSPNASIDLFAPELWDGVWFATGTSAATAFTTGIIALLMQEFSYLKRKPQRIKSILATTATSLEGYTEKTENGLFRKQGAGMINYQNFRDLPGSKCKEFDVEGNFTEGDVVYSTRLAEGAPGVKIRLTLTWLGTGYELNCPLTVSNKYTIKIIDNNGNVFAEATYRNSTTAFIYYPIPSVAEYYIKVYQKGIRELNKDSLVLSYYTYR